MPKKTRYSVIGLGKLGACTAACIASKGFDVVGVDIDSDTVKKINNGEAPVRETGLSELLKKSRKHLRATESLEDAVKNSDVTLIIVPTPSEHHGGFSLEYIKNIAKSIGKALKKKKEYHLVVIVSTVLPGSSEYGVKPVLEKFSGKKCGKDFGLCYNPEFIALGSVIHDFLNPDVVLIGEFDKKAGDMLEKLYKSVCDNKPYIARMNLVSAELAKIALNTYNTTKITFANMLAELCEHIPGADVDNVTEALAHSNGIGRKNLRAGLGFGGPCFPRDNVALQYMAHKIGARAPIAETTHAFNNQVFLKLLGLVKSYNKKGRRIGILGISYKAGSPITEMSQSFLLAQNLLQEGAHVTLFDPLIEEHADLKSYENLNWAKNPKELIKTSDIIVIANLDPKFKKITVEDFSSNTKQKKVVIDCWRMFRGTLAHTKHIDYVPFGVGQKNTKQSAVLKQLWS